MARALEQPARRWYREMFLALALGPILVWGADIRQALIASMPLRGLLGSWQVIASGLLTSAGIYYFTFFVFWGLAALGFMAIRRLTGRSLSMSRLTLAIVTVVFLLWMDF